MSKKKGVPRYTPWIALAILVALVGCRSTMPSPPGPELTRPPVPEPTPPPVPEPTPPPVPEPTPPPVPEPMPPPKPVPINDDEVRIPTTPSSPRQIACGFLRQLRRERLEQLGIQPHWTPGSRRRFTAKIDGGADYFLVVDPSSNFELLSGGGRPLEPLPTGRCWLLELNEGSYPLEVRAGGKEYDPEQDVKVLKVQRPTALSARINTAGEMIGPGSSGLPLAQLENLAREIERILPHAAALKELDVAEKLRVGWSDLSSQRILAEILENSLRHVIDQEEAGATVRYDLVAAVYRRLVAAATELDELRKHLRCLEANAVGRHIVKEADSLPTVASLQAALRVDAIVGSLGGSNSDCQCKLAGIEVTDEETGPAVEKMIEVATGYGESAFCDDSARHQERITSLTEFLDKLRYSCWIDDSGLLATFRGRLTNFRRDFETSLAVRNGELPRSFETAQRDLESLEKKLPEDPLNESALNRLKNDLDRISIPSESGAPFGGECVEEGRGRIDAAARSLLARRDDLANDIAWARRFAAVDWVQDRVLPRCSAVQEAASFPPVRKQIFCQAVERAIFPLKENRCDGLDRIDPYLRCRSQVCADRSQHLAELKADCCRRAQPDIRETISAIGQETAKLGNLAGFSWREFERMVGSVDRRLKELEGDVGRFSANCSASDFATEAQGLRSGWNSLRFGQPGLFEQLLVLMSGEGNPFSSQPDPRAVLDWAVGYGPQNGATALEWSKLLDVQYRVAQVVRECPSSGNEPSQSTRDVYEQLIKDKRDQFESWFSEQFRQRARLIVRNAENCMSRYDRRTISVKLDPQGEYQGEIDLELAEIIDQGRLVELKLVRPENLNPGLRNLTNITVEFFARGLRVEAVTPEGAPDNDPNRTGSYEGRGRQGFDAYRFREVWTAAAEANRMYYLIEPSGLASDAKLFLHVVPRAF